MGAGGPRDAVGVREARRVELLRVRVSARNRPRGRRDGEDVLHPGDAVLSE